MKRLTWRVNGEARIMLNGIEICGTVADRLAAYEDTGLEPEDIISDTDMAKIACALHELNAYKELGPIEHLRELVQADREGRIVLRSAGAGKKCGSCGNFHRIPGTKRGTCAIRQWERNRLGQTEHWRHSFTPSQSYGACRDYIPREDDNHERA